MVYPRGRLTLTYCSGHIWHVLIFDSSKNILNLFFFLTFSQSPSNFTKMKRIKDCILLSRCYRFLYTEAVLDWIWSFASFDMDFKSTSLKSNKGKWWFYGFVCIFLWDSGGRGHGEPWHKKCLCSLCVCPGFCKEWPLWGHVVSRKRQ